MEAGHLDILTLLAIDVRGRTRATITFALALQFLFVEVNVILFDMDNRLSEESVRFADEGRRDLKMQ